MLRKLWLLESKRRYNDILSAKIDRKKSGEEEGATLLILVN